MGESFVDLFSAMTGAPAPFPWQTRLYERLVANDLPDALDIPTGLGKTSVMAIWLLARLKNPRLPRRLVYVVNRRAIVDQASDVAEKLRLSAPYLSVSTLRGALADNRAWLRRPHEPAIIVGTVDMIGSRLLFDAYRAGKWSKAMHAGLLGQDSLIVHDEAHLSPAFGKLLKWIEQRQQHDRSPRPLCVLEMSATGGFGAQRIHAIGDDDRAVPAVQQRIRAVKRLKFHDAKNVVEQLAQSAFAQEGTRDAARRVIVFVREPATAQRVVDRLRQAHKVDAERIALLTGTIRGIERDRLVQTPPLRHLIDRTQPDRTTYLISTSAGEVGADFDADYLACDSTTLDAMIQRLGRVNRSGALGEAGAHVDIFADVTTAKPNDDYKRRMIATTAWLRGLPALDGRRLDASPEALSTRRKADDAAYRDAASKEPLMIEPHRATLDAWALTSIQEDWPVAAKLDPYLHGISDFQQPHASLAWRGEVAVFFPEPQKDQPTVGYDQTARGKAFETWLDRCPLRPREIVSDRCDRVIEALKAIAKRHANARFAMLHRGDITIQTFHDFAARAADKDDEKRLAREIADRFFILPADVGGLNDKGMLDGSVAARVTDVADAFNAGSGDQREADVSQRRVRIHLTADAGGGLTPRLFGPATSFVDSSEATDGVNAWTTLRNAVARGPLLTGMRQTLQIALQSDEDDTAPGRLLLFRATPPKDGRSEMKVLLGEHNADAGAHASTFATALVDAEFLPAIRLAAACHDYGKDRPAWQKSIKNVDPKPLAKSFGQGMDSKVLKGYRHEFGSLSDVTDPTKTNVLAEHREAFKLLDEHGRDLALHLIAAHHGRGRPCFPIGAFDPDNPLWKSVDALTPGEIARRYARLQRRFGHWGLAWLESLVMCADHAASRGEEPEDE